MILVSGASNNHYNTLIQFINSVIKNINFNDNILIIYDLDIEESKWLYLINKFKNEKIIFKHFNYNKYPEWFNININSGEYAWKPAIIYETSLEYENKNNIIIWMDSGNIIFNDLSNIKQILINNGIYTSFSCNTIKKWTHKKTLDIMNVDDSISNKINRNGACIGFNLNILSVFKQVVLHAGDWQMSIDSLG